MHTQQELANAIRALAMDAVEKARSGHPGMPMGMADIALVLWQKFLRHNPSNPDWVNRDRFVLSNGHGSMLLYALLHLSGYDLSMEEIKNFRQLHSKTPGHPEYRGTPGVETTTGPLGQGVANAIGMAISEKILAAEFNRENFPVVDHFTYVFLGDGCLMEGISHEACALAGNLGLGKLIVFWDDNGISIDGEIKNWMERSPAGRFSAYDWQVIENVDGHDYDAIETAIIAARAEIKCPTLICTRTIIGYGAPNVGGTERCHGAPLGPEEISLAKEKLGWIHPPFTLPETFYRAWSAKEEGAENETNWNTLFSNYRKQYPELACAYSRRMAGELPVGFSKEIDSFIAKTQTSMQNIASRKASQQTLEALGPLMPELFGGSADLSGSNLTKWSGSKAISRDNPLGNYIHWGAREFGMAHMVNGMVLHGGLRPYCGTFLMFMEFMRNALRMSGMMKIPTIFVYTHDSIGLGEDGPTHQPVEQMATMRVIPNLHTWRACDATETAIAWKMALLNRVGPTAIVLSRQTLHAQPRTDVQISNVERGGYTLVECDGGPEIILIATGSEVSLAVEAAKKLTIPTRVVSMPCTSLFDQQPLNYRNQVLTPGVLRVAVEAGVGQSWYRYVGLDGSVLSIEQYGASAPAKVLFETYGITTTRIVELVNKVLAKQKMN